MKGKASRVLNNGSNRVKRLVRDYADLAYILGFQAAKPYVDQKLMQYSGTTLEGLLGAAQPYVAHIIPQVAGVVTEAVSAYGTSRRQGKSTPRAAMEAAEGAFFRFGRNWYLFNMAAGRHDHSFSEYALVFGMTDALRHFKPLSRLASASKETLQRPSWISQALHHKLPLTPLGIGTYFRINDLGIADYFNFHAGRLDFGITVLRAYNPPSGKTNAMLDMLSSYANLVPTREGVIAFSAVCAIAALEYARGSYTQALPRALRDSLSRQRSTWRGKALSASVAAALSFGSVNLAYHLPEMAVQYPQLIENGIKTTWNGGGTLDDAKKCLDRTSQRTQSSLDKALQMYSCARVQYRAR